MNILEEKVHQAIEILKETHIDLWLTFVRETSGTRDPALDLIFGDAFLTWESALLICANGERIAIVGRYEVDEVKRMGVYSTVSGYDESIKPALLSVLDRLQPRSIAINTSRNNVHADGLTHGMYIILEEMLNGSEHLQQITSSEAVINALRGRKTPAEVELIRKAIRTTEQIYAETIDQIKIGMSEVDIANFMHSQTEKMGLKTAWTFASCPMVNAGPDSPVGHSGPTALLIQPGQIVHFDFGIKLNGFCSDIQRSVYILRPGETQAPDDVLYGFNVIRQAIEAARMELKPGIPGWKVDAAARETVVKAGFPEYKYATGHQLGRLAHDGGALLGPRWERYSNEPHLAVESGNVFTLEPGLMLPGFGYVGLEEDVLVTKAGAEYLGQPQTEMILVSPKDESI